MKTAVHDDDVVQRTLTKFLFDFEAGKAPDPEAYALQCPDEQSREEFRRALDHYPDLPQLLSIDCIDRDRVGPYRVERELGRGGMARVLEVWDGDLQRSLAMKVSDEVRLNADGSVPPGRERKVARFLQEAQITSQLRHPGIVPVHQLGIDAEGHVYFTMQLIEEATLADILERHRRDEGGWTQSKVMGVILKMCEAVAFAHAQGIIHRDLKPRNVMVGTFGEVYVLDWGLAKYVDPEEGLAMALSMGVPPETFGSSPGGFGRSRGEVPSLTRDGQVLGTLSYISPEQARHREGVDFRTDVYAAGAILYEFLAGRPPLLEEELGSDLSGDEILERIGRHEPAALGELAPGAPAELIAICEKAIARDPERRYASLIELRDDLRAFEEKRVVQAYATGAFAELRKWFQRNRTVALVCALAAFLLISSWAVFSHSRVQDARREATRNDAALLQQLVRERDAMLHIVTAERLPVAEAWLEDAGALAGRYGSSGALSAAAMPAFRSELAAFTREVVPEVRAAVSAARETESRDWDGLWAGTNAELAASPRYGFRVVPQVGLLPLGTNPETGLHEFVDLFTGERPGGAPGTYEIGEGTGLVYVLLPGGTFWFGSQSDDPDGRNYAKTRINELPLSKRTVVPFLASKYEMTQGQWLRVTGSNPSQFAAGSLVRDPTVSHPTHRWTDLTHPVELVSWVMCDEALVLVGARMPTEEEWEYGARADTETHWSTGKERESLEGHANIADKAAAKANLPTGDWADWPDLDDGHAWHAPIGSYRPNPFGLHDVHGNVWEWCDTEWKLEPGDLDVELVGTPIKVTRGGGWNNKAAYVRSSYRLGGSYSNTRASIGVRPVRDVETLR